MFEITVYQKMQTGLSFYLDKESKQKIYDHYVVNADNKQNYDNTSCISSPEKYGLHDVRHFLIFAFFSNKNKR